MFLKILLSAASGILLTISFPDAGLSWAAWFAIVPLLVAVKDVKPSQSFRLGLLSGLVHYLTLLYWLSYTMQTYGHLPVYLSVPVLFLLSFYLALYMALFSGLLALIPKGSIAYFFMIPLLWVSTEYMRSFLFSGFPWELLAYSQYNALHIIQVADILGPYGISFVIALSNAAFFSCFLRLSGKLRKDEGIPSHYAVTTLAVFVFFLSVFLYYGKNRIENTGSAVLGAPVVSVSVVQGNISQSEKWDPAFQDSTIEKYANLSRRAAAGKPDLMVWPETAAPFYFTDDVRMTKKVQNAATETGIQFLIGSPSFTINGNDMAFYNSAFMLDKEGKITGKYDKVHLVPFGEYVPFRKWLPFIGKMVEQVGDFSPGEKGSTISLNGHRLGVLICYELIFPYLSRAQVKNGAGFLVNMTNDAWYGETSAPYQHFSMAVFRAVENRRSIVRAANTGISGFIDPSGRITGATSIFEDAVMTRKIPLLNKMTFYTRFGDIFAFFCLSLSAAVFLVIIRRK
jgi:apolipoprotein N-acyltransferase